MASGIVPCPHCGQMIDYIAVELETIVEEVITADEGQHYEGDLLLDMASGGLTSSTWSCPKCKAIIEDIGNDLGLDTPDWAVEWLKSGLSLPDYIASLNLEE